MKNTTHILFAGGAILLAPLSVEHLLVSLLFTLGHFEAKHVQALVWYRLTFL